MNPIFRPIRINRMSKVLPDALTSRRSGLITAAAAASVLLAACSTGSTKSATSATVPPTTGQSASALASNNTAIVQLGHANIGAVLTNSAGKTLYSFSADQGSNLGCVSSTCTSEWAPLLVAAGTMLDEGPGLTGKLATVARSGGEMQVTYNGLPLYTYSGDSGAGQASGQGLTEHFGAVTGTWTAATPTSKAVAAAAATTTTAKPASNVAPAATQPATTQAPASTNPATTAPATTRPPTTMPPTTSPPTTYPPTTSPPTTSAPTTVPTWS